VIPQEGLRDGADVALQGQRKAAGAVRAAALMVIRPPALAAPRKLGGFASARCKCDSQPTVGALRAPLKT
jgi:hypothetical protein